MTRLRIVVLVLMTALASCAQRGELVMDPAAASVGTVEPVYIGTTRGLADKSSAIFGSGRHAGLQFARLDVSIRLTGRQGISTGPERALPPTQAGSS